MKWIVKRAARAVLTILLVFHASFLLVQYLPGGPLQYLRAQLSQAGIQYSEEQINAIAQTYLNMNPDASLQEKYLDYMSNIIFEGSLGQSISFQEPVTGLLAEAVPWTIFLMLNAIVISFTVGVSIGAVMAYFEGSLFDNFTSGFSIVFNSIPYYVIGILLVFVLGYQMELFPITGRYNGTKVTPGINLAFIQNVLYHVFLPMMSWAFAGFGGWALAMRGNSIRVLGEDYLRVGRLRGLPTHRLTLQYVARNAILPLYTNILIVLGGAFGGSVVLETIFVYRGMGYYLFRAIESNDYPLLMGGFLLIVTSVIFALFFAELTYGMLDPRAQDGGAGNESY